MLMVYKVKSYFSIVFKTLNMSQINLTWGTPDGPKGETIQVLKKLITCSLITPDTP